MGNNKEELKCDVDCNNSVNFFPKTKQLLEYEICVLNKCRDGVGFAWNILKRDGTDDEHLRKLYCDFDSRSKEYQEVLDVLQEECDRNCVHA